MKFILIAIILAFAITANSQLVYVFNSASGLMDYTSTAGSVSETTKAGCPSGSCIRVGNSRHGNDASVNGNVVAMFSTSGAEGCELRMYAH